MDPLVEGAKTEAPPLIQEALAKGVDRNEVAEVLAELACTFVSGGA
jgi:hypothetical protein